MTIHAKINAKPNERPTPLRAVRRHCVDCCGGNMAEPGHCTATACPLWSFRFGRNPNPEERDVVADVNIYPLERGETGYDVASRTALKSIPERCLDCAGSLKAVQKCSDTNCDLHCYRFGKGNRQLSPVQRQQAAKRLQQARWGKRSSDDTA